MARPLTVLLAAALCTLVPRVSEACSCDIPDPRHAFAEADAVVLARVLSIREGDLSAQVHVRILRSWKGPTEGREADIWVDNTMCRNAWFTEGDYLAYLKGPGANPKGDLAYEDRGCTRTKLLGASHSEHDLADDLAYLDGRRGLSPAGNPTGGGAGLLQSCNSAPGGPPAWGMALLVAGILARRIRARSACGRHSIFSRGGCTCCRSLPA